MYNASPERLEQATKNAEELLSRLSLTEKIGQLSQFGTSIYNDELQYHSDHYEDGRIGSYLAIKKPDIINYLQRECKDRFPTYVPLLFAEDVIHGFRTTFPMPIAQSCSFNPEVARRGAEVAAKEAYIAGIRWTFSPMVDIARDARWGRIVEGYGEDPYLCSRMSEATVKGYQGDEIGQKYRLMACMKHFIGYGGCVGGRDYNEVEMSLPTLMDIYLPSFKAGIDAGAATVMSAFNSLNGVPCTGNRWLLKDILRGKLGFDGFVVSDWAAVNELVPHGFAEDEKDAMEKGFTAGVNMLMAGDGYNNHLPTLIEEGKITESDIDEALKPILIYKYLLGLFEDPFADEEEAERVFFCDEHIEACRQAGRECIVMLENDGILPLKKDKKIAVIGPMADDNKEVLGTWSCWADPEKTITIYEGLKAAGYDVCTARGCSVFEGNDAEIAEAAKLAAECDIALLVLGEEAGMTGEAQSRVNHYLTGCQQKLLNSVLDTGKPVVLLISSGRPLILGDYRKKVNALAYIWQLGTSTGLAVADVLSGDFDVSGRLSVSAANDTRQLPLYYNRPNCGRPYTRTSGFHMGYRDNYAEPDYPFGYGLSYTSFEYSDLKLSADSMPSDGSITVSCTVKNTGDREGSTVVQLYVRDMVGCVVRPIKELKGFRKFSLKAGESRSLSFELKAEALAFHDTALRHIVEAGDFTLWVAQHSDDNTLSATFRVTDTREID